LTNKNNQLQPSDTTAANVRAITASEAVTNLAEALNGLLCVRNTYRLHERSRIYRSIAKRVVWSVSSVEHVKPETELITFGNGEGSIHTRVRIDGTRSVEPVDTARSKPPITDRRTIHFFYDACGRGLPRTWGRKLRNQYRCESTYFARGFNTYTRSVSYAAHFVPIRRSVQSVRCGDTSARTRR
jgi:hypothetical protein